MKPSIRLDWATTEAARYAVEHWHYTRTLPVGKLVKVGVWEGEKFIGCILFAWGMNKDLGTPYGLQMQECCELVRVALTAHKTPVSQMMAFACKMLKRQSPGLRLIVSFADPNQGHHGGIYQACGWVYAGLTASSIEYKHNGKTLHKRAYTGHNYGKPRMQLPAGTEKVKTLGKHRYLFALDTEKKARIKPLSRPYPKRTASIVGDASVVQTEEGGSTPTAVLHEAR